MAEYFPAALLPLLDGIHVEVEVQGLACASCRPCGRGRADWPLIDAVWALEMNLVPPRAKLVTKQKWLMGVAG